MQRSLLMMLAMVGMLAGCDAATSARGADVTYIHNAGRKDCPGVTGIPAEITDLIWSDRCLPGACVSRGEDPKPTLRWAWQCASFEANDPLDVQAPCIPIVLCATDDECTGEQYCAHASLRFDFD